MVYTAPLIDGTGVHKGWMSSVVDISAQKRAEAREHLQEQQLQHQQRRLILGEMVTTIAHEMNQPLMAVNPVRECGQGLPCARRHGHAQGRA